MYRYFGKKPLRSQASPYKTKRAALPYFRQTEHLFTFALGALGYGLLEVAWRGHTHWSMLLCGGLALLMLRRLSLSPLPFLLQCTAGALGITGLELAAGVLFNCILELSVWDYSGMWGNLWGQICPLYSVLWFVLCVAVLGVMRIAWQNPYNADHLHRQ